MPLTAVVMIFFGAAVLYDSNVHKRERKPAAKLLLVLIGIFSLLYGIVNFMQAAGFIH